MSRFYPATLTHELRVRKKGPLSALECNSTFNVGALETCRAGSPDLWAPH